MITSSGKQSDKELETSFVYLMQMPDVHVCTRDIAEFKISLPSSSLAHPRTAPGPNHLQVFSSSTAERVGQGGAIAPPLLGTKTKRNKKIEFKQRMANMYLFMTQPPPPPPLLNMLHRALWMGKENVIWTRGPFG